jgi:hypothetical protein
MSQLTPPWCLHWGSDGELAQSDRSDLLLSLASQENSVAHLMLAQARGWVDHQARHAGMADERQANALTKF